MFIISLQLNVFCVKCVNSWGMQCSVGTKYCSMNDIRLNAEGEWFSSWNWTLLHLWWLLNIFSHNFKVAFCVYHLGLNYSEMDSIVREFPPVWNTSLTRKWPGSSSRIYFNGFRQEKFVFVSYHPVISIKSCKDTKN